MRVFKYLIFDQNNYRKIGRTLLLLGYSNLLNAQAVLNLDTIFKTLPSVEIVSATPVSGSSLNRNEMTSTIQSISAKNLHEQNTTTLTQYLNQHLGSVHLNFAGGNILQPDLNYRGFTASPVLGLSQGVAVFQDGARLNELFGNVVNWDVIPTFALENVELVAGSNPVFGLNALGGALSLKTKSGFSNLGNTISLEGGSFGRLHATAEAGGNNGKLGYYIGSDFFKEKGWRNYSPSQAGRLFAKGSWQSGKNMLHLSIALAKSQLRGNGPAPVDLLNINRREVFTHPDITENKLGQLNLQWSRSLNKDWRFQAVFYNKWMNSKTFNGDNTPYEVCDTGKYAGLMCYEPELNSQNALDWQPILDENGQTIQATDATNSAINNRTNTQQLTVGSTFQVMSDSRFLNKKNHFIVGLSLDGGQAQFKSSVELAKLNNERGTEGGGFYDADAAVDLKFKAANSSLYFLESLSVVDSFIIQFSGQLQHSTIQLRDQLGEELNGDHEYLRFNPALGFVWQFNNTTNMFGNYSISARTPTPVELTCADPEAPCRLPNAFLSDPPLKQAVAHTSELGFRFNKKHIETTLTLFRSTVYDDIYFISAGASRNTGYFSNIGNTLRTGLEMGFRYNLKNWAIYSNYTWLNATFQEDFTINSAFHPEADDGEIEVKKGNQLPLIPNHLAKLGLEYRFAMLSKKTIQSTFGMQLLYNGSQVLRGDEANTLNKIKAYTVGNLYLNCRFFSKTILSVRLENIGNKRYETFGLLGQANALKGFEQFKNPFFLTPGEPLSFSIGIKFLL